MKISVSHFDSDRVEKLWSVRAFFALYSRDNQISTVSVNQIQFPNMYLYCLMGQDVNFD